MTNASGIGSWPGTDSREAIRIVRDLLVEDGIPYLPETPARGPGADMIGRATGLLVELPVDLQPSGWRFVDRPGRDAARTASFWRQDLDEIAEAYDGHTGPLKLQVTGPWTLAASVELNRGEKAAGDPAARADVIASLAEGVRLHLAEVARLVPGADLVLQLDEPGLPAVLEGRLPTVSGYGRLAAVDRQEVAAGLSEVLAAAGERTTVVHCCHPDAPLALLRESGASAIAVDLDQWERLAPEPLWDTIAEIIESPVALWAGIHPSNGGGAGRDWRTSWDVLHARWVRLGLTASDLDRLVITPACGLAWSTQAEAVAAQRAAREIAKAATDLARS
ncbi:methionine synthase [Janibacter sp. G56]|uniref:methionine synthase n=1 Tax=Janibacter sp. G56 TaxID=3418717 RepID=UPI003D055A09